MRLSSASPFDGSAREESGKVCKTSKTSKTIKRQDKNPKPNKVDRIDDKIRLASKWVEVLATARPPSKALRLPAWRPIHWIRPFDRISLLSFLRGGNTSRKACFRKLVQSFLWFHPYICQTWKPDLWYPDTQKKMLVKFPAWDYHNTQLVFSLHLNSNTKRTFDSQKSKVLFGIHGAIISQPLFWCFIKEKTPIIGYSACHVFSSFTYSAKYGEAGLLSFYRPGNRMLP